MSEGQVIVATRSGCFKTQTAIAAAQVTVDQLLVAKSRQATISVLNKLQAKDNAFGGKVGIYFVKTSK